MDTDEMNQVIILGIAVLRMMTTRLFEVLGIPHNPKLGRSRLCGFPTVPSKRLFY